jgi:hypothetical protein
MKLHRWAPHLHVSYYDVEYDSEERYVEMKAGLLAFASTIGYNKPSEKNPFWHSSGSCTSASATNT